MSDQILPSHWRLEHIGDLIERIESVNPSLRGEGTFKYVDISSVDNGQKKIMGANEIENSQAPSRARQVIATNDVLVSTVRPNLNAVALVSAQLDGEICSTGFCVLRPKSNFLNAEFLFAWVRHPTFITNLVRLERGIGYPAVSDNDVKAQQIPLPPLVEQERIVAILKQADELRRLRRAANEKAQGLIQALSYEMFGKPNSWYEERSLEDFVDFVGGGTPSRKIERYFTGDIPWATSKDMKSRYLSDAQEHITIEAIENSSTNLVPAGTILIVVKSKILAHTLPIAITTRSFCFGQDLKGMIPKPGVAPQFIVSAILAQAGSILNKARGVNTEGLTLEILRSIAIPPITPDEQKRFVDQVHEYDRLEQRQTSSVEKLDALFESLLAQAFKGELTEHWREQHRVELARQAEEMRALLTVEKVPSGVDAILVGDDGQITFFEAKLTGMPRRLEDFLQELITNPEFPRYWTLLDIANALRMNEIPRAALREAIEMLVVMGDVRPAAIRYDAPEGDSEIIQAYTRVTETDLVGAKDIRL